MKKRILSMLLACLMIFSLMPTTVFAAASNVAKIGTTEYATLQAAFDAAQTTETNVELLQDVTLSAGLTITGGKNVKLDLKSYTITKPSTLAHNTAAITVTDATLTITGNENGKIDASVKGTGNGVNTAVKATGASTINMAGGTIYGYESAVWVEGTSVINVSGGTLGGSKSTSSIFIVSSATSTISGGIVYGVTNGGYPTSTDNRNSGSVLNIIEGTVKYGTNNGLYTQAIINYGTVNISGGTIVNTDVTNPYASLISNYKVLNISENATIEGQGNKVVIENIAVTSGNNKDRATNSNYRSNGELTVTGGKLSSAGKSELFSNAANCTTAVSGGVFNKGIPDDCLATNYECALNTDTQTKADYPYTVATATGGTKVAKVGYVKYSSLAAAVDAAVDGDTVTLLDNCSGDGIIINKSLTIDLNGKTYTVCGPTLAGSAGTETQGFQLLKECGNITFKNGKIDTTVEADAKILIQNYANLTLDNVTLDGTNLTDTKYTSSNNNGTVVYKNGTKIIAAEDGVAFDAYDYASGGYDGVSVSIADAGVVIDGVIEIDGDRSGEENKAEVKVPEGYVLYKVAEKRYVIKAESDYVAQIGDVKYFSLAEAIAAVPTDGTETTITMIGNETLAVNTGVTIPADKTIILDLNNHTVTGSATNQGSCSLITNRGTLTVTDNSTGKGGTLTSSVDPGQYNAGYYVISNYGTCTIAGGNIVEATTDPGWANNKLCYAIDNSSNGGTPTLNITGGRVECSYQALRAYAYTNDKITINISGGEVSSFYGPLGAQFVTATPNVEYNITGGTIESTNNSKLVYLDAHNANTSLENVKYNISGGFFKSSSETVVNRDVTGGGYVANADIESGITGGYFTAKITDHIATGYACVANTDSATRTAYPYVVKAVTTEVAEVKAENGKIVVDETPVTVEVKPATQEAPAALTNEQVAEVAQEINTIITNPEVATFEDTKIDEATKDLTTQKVTSGSFNIAKILELVREEAAKQYTASATNNDEIGVTVSGAAAQTFTTADVTTKITVDLTSTAVETTTETAGTQVVSATVSTLTFDVKPVATITVDKGNGQTEVVKAVIKNEDIKSPITFRLPVKDGWTEVRVSHNGIYKGTYFAQGEAGNRYVELASNTFSYWTVENNEFEDTDAVAKTGNRYYDSLAEALKDAANGDTVEVLQNTSINDELFIANKSITLNLGGFTVDVTAPTGKTIPIHIGTKDNSTAAAGLTVKNGTINGTASGNVFGVYGMTTDGSAKRSLTLDGVTMNVTGGYAVALNNNGTTNNYHGYGAEITIKNSTLKAPYVISVNGSIQDTEGNFPKVKIENSTLKANDTELAIYAAGYAAWDIDGSTITGGTGLYAKAGTFDIDGGKIEATGAFADPVPNGNGGNSTGDAIIMDSKTGYAGNMVMNLNGVTVSSVNGNAVHEALTDMETTSTQSITITNGTYTAAADKETVATSKEFDRAETTTLTVAGTPTGVTAQTDLGKFTSFSVDYGDGLDYSVDKTHTTSRWSQFVNVVGGETAATAKTFMNGDNQDSIVNFATKKTDAQNLTVHFGVTMGTVSYAVGEITEETEFVTIKDGNVLTLAQNGQPLVFQIECGSGVTNFFTFTPTQMSISVPYTLHVKPLGADTVDPTYDANTAKYVEYGVYATVPTSENATPIGSYDFTLSYDSAFTFDTSDENCTFTPKNGTVEKMVVDAELKQIKVAVALDTGIEPEVASSTPSYSAQLGTLKLKVAENSENTISINIANDTGNEPVVTPKGYDKNNGTITTKDHTQYLISYTYTGATGIANEWILAGKTPTMPSVTLHTGWSLATDAAGEGWNPATPVAVTGPVPYHYTARHDQYTVTWNGETPMTVTKTVYGNEGTTENVTNGGTMYYEEALTVTPTITGDRTVIRNGDFKYKLDEANATGVSREGDTGFTYKVGPNVVNANVVLSYITTEYVTVTFSGGTATTLKDDNQANNRDDLTAYTLKGANEGDADALYASVNDFIKGNGGTKYNIPMQVPNDDARLVPPEALNNKDNQQWKIDGTTDKVANSVLTADTPSQVFTADTILTADAVNTHKVTFMAGSGSFVTNPAPVTEYRVDAGTPIENILTFGTVANKKVYDNSEGTPKLVAEPKVVPVNGYKFDKWQPSVDGNLAGDITITAQYEVAKYSIGVSDNAAFKNLTGADANGKISKDADVSFKLMLKKNTRIESVSYTVAGGANGTTFEEKTVSNFQPDANGVYTIPAIDIRGDVTVTVQTVNTVKITVKSADAGKGTVGGTTAFVVDAGSAVSALAFTGLTTTAEPGYEVEKVENKIVFYTKDSETLTAFNAETFTAETTLYVKFVDAKYVIELDDLVDTNNLTDITVPVTPATDYTVTHGTNAVFKLAKDANDPQIITSVTYSVEGGVQNVLLQPVNGYYTIPGERIIGKVTVTVKTLADEASINKPIKALFIYRDDEMARTDGIEGEEGSAYMANVVQNGDMKILALVSEAFKATDYVGTSKFFQLANGTQFYWSDRYDAYVCWVSKDMKVADLDGFVKFDSTKTATAIVNEGDINFDGSVDSADAGIVNDTIHGTRQVPTSALQLFEMDVANTSEKSYVSGATIDANDVTWILKNTVKAGSASKAFNPLWTQPQ